MLRYMKKPLCFLLLLLLWALPVAAGVYRWVDAAGQVHFSDQPVAGAERIELPEPTVYSPPPLPGEEEPEGDDLSGTAYTRFAIVRPSNDETIYDNEGNIKVSIEIQPALTRGDRFRVLLDGAAVGDLTTPQITLQNVDRGTHSVVALILDRTGRELARSAPVTFHLRKTSILDGRPRPEHPVERPPGDEPPDVTLPVEPPPEVTLPVEPPPEESPEAPTPGEGEGGNAQPQHPYAPNYKPSYGPNYNPGYRPAYRPVPARP